MDSTLKEEMAKHPTLSRGEWYRQVYLYSDHWKELRFRALEFYGRKCNRCPETEYLQVHHKRYRDIYDVEIGDLEILCGACHQAHHDKPKSKRLAAAKTKKGKRSKKAKKSKGSHHKAGGWSEAMVAEELEKWKHRFRRHSSPEVSAIAHVLRTRGWFIPKQIRFRLKSRKKNIVSSHPMIQECHEMDHAFDSVSGP